MARKKKEKEERKKLNKRPPKKQKRKAVRKRNKKKPESSSSQEASGKKQHQDSAHKKPRKSTGLDSVCKTCKPERTIMPICFPVKISKKAKPDSGCEELEKKAAQHWDSKKTDKKSMAERKEGKKTNVLVGAGDTKGLPVSAGTDSSRPMRDTDKLTRETKERMKELRQDGVIILIDQPNLEIGKRMQMEATMPKRKYDKKSSWVIRYGRLKEIVAKAGPGSEPRIILKTCVMTSRNSQVTSWEGQPTARHGLSKSLQKRHDIEYLISPMPADKRTPHATRGHGAKDRKEKSVDAMVVRRMVEEYAALDIFRLQGLRVPKRTFCLFTADADFADVAKVAREKGFDVELWFFEKVTGFSLKKWAKASGECETSGCGGFRRVDVTKYEKKISKWTYLKEDRDWSTVVSE